MSFFHEAVGVERNPLVSQFIKGHDQMQLGRALRAQVQAPYEPLEQFNFKFLFHKTAFLLAVCSAERVSAVRRGE